MKTARVPSSKKSSRRKSDIATPNENSKKAKTPKKKLQVDSVAIVSPQPAELPIDRLPWKEFEKFCRRLLVAILGSEPENDSYEYGKEGDEQEGIDLVFRRQNREIWVAQCKKRVRFSASNMREAIATATYKANHYLLLTTVEATTSIRKVVEGHPTWQLWDKRDIAEKVRELPRDIAVHIIDESFGIDVRHAFLGISGLIPFIRTKDYFKPFQDRSRLFHHAWEFVGRNRYIDSLVDFFYADEQRVALLGGRGGIGKTRLLRAFAEKIAIERRGIECWFLNEHVPLQGGALDHLPPKDCIIFLDDAHRRYGEVALVLELVKQQPYVRKLVLSFRLHGLPAIRAALLSAGFDGTQVRQLESLESPKKRELVALVKQALVDKDLCHHAEAIAIAARDSPLVALMAARLLAERRVEPAILVNDKEFRDHVLERFSSEMLGNISSVIPAITVQNVLGLIAAVQPFRIDDDRMLDVAQEFLGLRRVELIACISALETSEVLARSKNRIRIVPDVLADYILHQKCVTDRGDAKGYAAEVFQRFSPVCMSAVLQNLSELDWRISKASPRRLNEVDRIWEDLALQFRQGGGFERLKILDALGNAVIYQPERALALIKHAYRFPHTDANSMDSWRASISQQMILDRVARILQTIANSCQCVSMVYDWLWMLGRDCPGNSYDSTFGVLLELVRYRDKKPLVLLEEAAAAVKRWLQQRGVYDHQHSPLEVIEKLLEGNVDVTAMVGSKVRFGHYVVPLNDRVAAIRTSAMESLELCANSADRKVVLHATHVLEGLLHERMDFYGTRSDEKKQALWDAEKKRALDVLGSIAGKNSHPAVQLAIYESIGPLIRRFEPPPLKEMAIELLGTLADTPEFRLARALRFAHHREPRRQDFLLPMEEIAHFKAREERWSEFINVVADEFSTQEHPMPTVTVDMLESLLAAISEWTSFGHPKVPLPHMFFGRLASTNPALAASLCVAIIAKPGGLLLENLISLLYGVRRNDFNYALRIEHSMLRPEAPALARVLAQALSNFAWDLREDEESLLEWLLAHTDVAARAAASHALHRFGTHFPDRAARLLLGIDLGGSTACAQNVCALVLDEKFLPSGGKPDHLLLRILCQLEAVDEIGDYWIKSFLTLTAERLPQSTVESLTRRIVQLSGAQNRVRLLDNDSLGDALAPLVSAPNYDSIFQAALVSLRDADDVYGASGLVRDLSVGYHPRSLRVIREWLSTADSATLEWLSDLFIFPIDERMGGENCDLIHPFCIEPDFIEDVLTHAHRAGADSYDRVMRKLLNATVPGSMSSTAGEAPPILVSLHEQAKKAAEHTESTSHARSFFDAMAENLQFQIRGWKEVEDELEEDE